MNGTPKTLLMAIRGALKQGPLAEWNCRRAVRDLLAQRFGVAYLEYSDDPVAMEALQKLWISITGETGGLNEIDSEMAKKS